ncbi:unnamed protein product [Somion occarium]|uniref:Serine/threonine-protein phosphatase 2A activator n=1 Tax=Somion occarium TaxID=3059160 RepID=A0ABP1E9A2_9APHY
MTAALPPLRQIPISEAARLTPPKLRIKTDDDVACWRDTRGYHDYGLFLRRLNESVVGYFLPYSSPSMTQATTSILSMLDKLDSWINEIPPLPTPQRFGNLAFRTWGKKLEDNVDSLLTSLLPSEFAASIPLISPYLVTSFGSFTRMDYGTGHETSFALFLLCLTLIRFFEPLPEQERDLVLVVFLRYLRLCWRLQDVYRLEPAGSHGVWGLDDYSFLSYIFGSAQLRESDISVTTILRRPLPPTNLYFLSISRIHEVKTGPFHEHSSQLYNIATGVPRWAKVNSGLFKMYEAEVLGKRVVVQHIPLGGLMEWDITSSDPMKPDRRTHALAEAVQAPWATPAAVQSSFPSSLVSSSSASGSTRFPSSSMPAMAPTAAPWVTTSPSPSHESSLVERRVPGPIVPASMPLGPAANTTLRPMAIPRTDSKNQPMNAVLWLRGH